MLHNAIPRDAHITLNAPAEAQRFAEHTRLWHTTSDTPATDLILQLHRANYDLWHLEDAARSPNAHNDSIAEIKRTIDKTNQRRNDLVEKVDTSLLVWLAAAGLPAEQAPLHSETPGLILDRLSILSLKLFHTQEEIDRPGAGESHIHRNQERLAILKEQSQDLLQCLTLFWEQVCCGERRFKLYRQLKMYNDPDLNPFLYTTSDGHSVSGA